MGVELFNNQDKTNNNRMEMIKILTCKVGENIINTIDYTDSQIKKWKEKGILKCPVCKGEMIYKNGEFKIAHFAHKINDCSLLYSEPESEEHLSGKKAIYEWLKTQDGIEDLVLEAWLPDTKQKPDISFTYSGQKYVIEYQCSPIATKYAERHRLYELAGIKDIWILGTEKYDIKNNTDEIIHKNLIDEYSTKIIEREIINSSSQKYIFSNDKAFMFVGENSIEKITDVVKFQFHCRRFLFSEIKISDLILNIDVCEPILQEETRLKRIEEEKIKEQYKVFEENIQLIVDNLNNQLVNEFDDNSFSLTSGSSTFYYLCKIVFYNHYNTLTFFIKQDVVDCCVEYEDSIPFRGKRGGTGWRKKRRYHNIDSLNYQGDIDMLSHFISEQSNDLIAKYENELRESKKKYYSILKNYLNQEIYLINGGGFKVPDNIRFKFLKGFRVDDDYMINKFIKEIDFLKKIKADKFVFMIPKYHSFHNSLGFRNYVRVGDFGNEIIKYFKSYGFTKVKYLDY